MDYTFWGAATVSGNLGVPPYFRGGYVKGAEPGERLKRLERLLEADDYDLIVVSGFDWNSLPLFARYEILKRVKKGTGLIKIDRAMLTPVDPDDKYFRKATKDRMPVPSSVAAGVPWQALPVFKDYKDTRDFLESTLRASRFGLGKIITLHGYKLPPRHLLCPGFSRDPLPSWWDSHWNSLPDEQKAKLDMPISRIKRLHYDYYLAYLIKVMLFATDRLPDVTIAKEAVGPEFQRNALSEISFPVESPRDADLPPLAAEFVLRDVDNNVLARSAVSRVRIRPGDNRLSFPVSNIPAGQYFADLWLRHNGRTVAFGSMPVRIHSKTRIAKVVLDADHFRTKDNVTGKVGIDATGARTGSLKLVIRQKDNF